MAHGRQDYAAGVPHQAALLFVSTPYAACLLTYTVAYWPLTEIFLTAPVCLQAAERLSAAAVSMATT